MNQRSDFIEAKQKCKRLCDEHTEITGEGNKPIPLAQQVRHRLDQQFEGLEEYNYRLEPRTGVRFYPSSRTTHSSSSTHWQQSSHWKSNRKWDSWQTSSWTEQYFLLCSEMSLRLPDRAPHFLMHSRCTDVITCCQSVQSRIDLHALAWLKTEAHLCVAPQNASYSSLHVLHLAVLHTTHEHSFLALPRSTATAAWRPDGSVRLTLISLKKPRLDRTNQASDQHGLSQLPCLTWNLVQRNPKRRSSFTGGRTGSSAWTPGRQRPAVFFTVRENPEMVRRRCPTRIGYGQQPSGQAITSTLMRAPPR